MRRIILSLVLIILACKVHGQNLTVNFALIQFEQFENQEFTTRIIQNSSSQVANFAVGANITFFLNVKDSKRSYYGGVLFQLNDPKPFSDGTVIIGNSSKLETFKYGIGSFQSFSKINTLRFGYGLFYKERKFINTQSETLSKSSAGVELSLLFERSINFYFLKRFFIGSSLYPDVLNLDGFIVDEDYSGIEPGNWNFSIGLGIDLFKLKKKSD